MAEESAFTEEMMFDRLFREARTHNVWTDRPVTDETLRAIYDLAKWGPTTANSNPARFVFIRSPEAKARLRPLLTPGNVEKVMQAPCTVIVAWDTRFYENYPKLFPSRDMRPVFEGKDELIADAGLRSSTLQGAYFMLAARALGLDCGPMSGFDLAGTDAEFFPDGRWKSNFLCNLGYGKHEDLFPRNPRLDYAEACLEL